MLENKHIWKLTANFFQNYTEENQFGLDINGKDYYELDFIRLSEEDVKTLMGDITFNYERFLDENKAIKWNSKIFEDRVASKVGKDEKIHTILLKDIRSSSGIIQEMFNFLPRYISNNGLSVLVLDNFPQGIVLDDSALKRMLNNLSELTKFSLRNMN